MKQYILLFFILILFGESVVCSAQVTIGSVSPPVKAALLDLKTKDTIGPDNVSADKGLLLPRVKLSDLTSLEPLVISATTGEKKDLAGLQVYNMNETSPFSKGVYIWNGESWDLYHQPITGSSSGLEAGNGISLSSPALRLGGVLTEATSIDLADHNLNFEQTTGNFSVNTNALVISKTGTGIGTFPLPDSKLTVGGNMLVRDSLIVNGSTSSLRQTTVTDSLWIKNPVPGIDARYILKSTDAAGTSQWVPLTDIPNYNPSSYKEAVITGGLTLTQSDWNSTTQYRIPGFELKLTPGLWLVYLSVVVEPLNAAQANAAATNAQNPIWGRFRFDYYNGSTYAEPSTTQTAAVARIGALNVSDRVYPNVTKNVIKGYLILRVNGTERTLHLCMSNRSTASGYAAWSGTSYARIGDPGEPQNYAVAFPL